VRYSLTNGNKLNPIKTTHLSRFGAYSAQVVSEFGQPTAMHHGKQKRPEGR